MALSVKTSRRIIFTPIALVPKLCLGTHFREALLRERLSKRFSLLSESISRDRNSILSHNLACEAELRGSAFPSSAWERGKGNGVSRQCVPKLCLGTRTSHRWLSFVWLCLPFFLLLLWTAPASAQSVSKDKLESNIDRALEFLQRLQDSDGAWRLASTKSPGATSLAVMAFLSAGHVPGEGPYGETIDKGIRWVLKAQKDNGLIASYGYEMYEHGISTLMLAEVSGMTSAELSPQVKKALEKGVKIILQGQRKDGQYRGGWRYQVHGNDADISVTGWQLLALRAARNLGCDIPAERIDMAVEFIKRCRDAASGGFTYQPSGMLTIPCTGTSILCLELCHKHHAPESLKAGTLLIRQLPTWGEYHFFYNVYYGSQATFQLGNNYWNVYRPHLHKVLFDRQQANGSWLSGADSFGPAYATSMAILALTVEYRYLPIYQRGEEPEMNSP